MADLGSALVVEAIRGLEVVDRQVFPLSGSSPAVPIRCADARGLTSVTLRYRRQATGLRHDRAVGRVAGDPQPALPHGPRGARPRRRPGPVPGPGRRRRRRQAGLAAQPRLRADADRAHDRRLPGQRRRRRSVVQRAGFRTRGLPGPQRGRGTGHRARALRRVGLPRRHPAALPPRAGRARVRRAVQHRCCRSTARPRPATRPSGPSCSSGCSRSSRPTAGDCRCPPPTGSSPIAAPRRRRAAGCRG